MTLQRKIKKNALLSLKNHWGRAISILLFQTAVYVFFFMMEQILCKVLELTAPNSMGIRFSLGTGLVVSGRLALLTAMALLVSAVVLSPIGMGAKRWYYEQVTGTESPILSIFSYFLNWKTLFRVIGLRLIVRLCKLGWAIVFAIPSAALAAGLYFMDLSSEMAVYLKPVLVVLWGIVTLLMGGFWYLYCQRYQLTDFIFICDNEISLTKAIRLSAKIMNGSKQQLFLLKLSMLPWALLSVLAVPAMFTIPYYTSSTAIFSAYKLESFRRSNTEK